MDDVDIRHNGLGRKKDVLFICDDALANNRFRFSLRRHEAQKVSLFIVFVAVKSGYVISLLRSQYLEDAFFAAGPA